MMTYKILILIIGLAGTAVAQVDPPAPAPFGPAKKPSPLYQQLKRANVEGIGKFYLGRQISHVMGHQGARWLERPEREREENTSEMIRSLKLRPGDQVADIGVGTGYIARRIAKVIGEKGIVFGVDIQPEMLELLDKKMKAAERWPAVQWPSSKEFHRAASPSVRSANRSLNKPCRANPLEPARHQTRGPAKSDAARYSH